MRPLTDAYSGPDALALAISHAFAHILADAFAEPQPDPNPYCPYCDPGREHRPVHGDTGAVRDADEGHDG